VLRVASCRVVLLREGWFYSTKAVADHQDLKQFNRYMEKGRSGYYVETAIYILGPCVNSRVCS
jgi:hypothetical protein